MARDESPTFGILLTRYRAALGLTQEELAERAGLSVRGLRDLERGVKTRPRAYTVRQLVEALELLPDDRALFEQAARAADTAPAEAMLPVGNFLGALPPSGLVAREGELEHIRSVLDRVAEGAGQLLLLSGELGVGKTRLLQEVMVEAQQRGYLVLTGRCYSTEHTSPFSPILAALSASDASMPAKVRADWQRGWKRAKSLLAVDRADTGTTSGTVIAPPEVLGSVTDLLLLAAGSMPVALLLDDLQWADAESLTLLQHLGRTTRGAPILLAASFHDVRLSEKHPELALALQTLGRERLAERVTVRRLSLEETTQLAAATMDQQEVSEEFASFVYRRTKGNPRLIDQLVQSLGGRLELQGEIGAGAMGRVFRAFDRTLEQTVAAKLVLARQEIDLDTLLRFQQEGAVLAQLEHPHIVDIYDSFAEEHASCIIMELLDGQSLGQILVDGPLPLERAKVMATQVADALVYAHSQEIVHRDIKPDNVMVLDGDQVKVTDFGIARILQPDTSLQTIATTGMRMGTPLYMAPEQIEGKKIDPRTDIYALGATLYHMVAGRSPFAGSDALTVAVKHLQEEPLPPSQVNSAVPADWDALVLKAMAKDPAKRFQSADEMRHALAALGEPAPSRMANVRRSWRAAAAVTGVIVFLVAVFGVLWAHATTDNKHPGPVASIDAYLTQNHFSGYVLLERRGHVLLSKGYGAVDTKSGQPNTIRSAWLDAGTYRFMTVIAILRLQDERKLSVHDTFCHYVTGCPRTWRPITIHQLLLDTSGLGSFDTTAVPGGVNQALARCKALPVGVPGAIAPRSACNALLLNTIIVKVSGKPWATAMHDLVFGPGHMVTSGRLTHAATPADLVQGYSAGVPVQLGNLNNSYLPYSSIQDLEQMDRALLSGRLLSRSALHALFTPYISGGALLNRYFEANGSNATQLAGGYESFLRKGTRTTLMVADEPGLTAGISLDDAVSPEDGTIAIMARNNESGPDPTDLIFGPASHLLWGKQAATPPSALAPAKRIAAYLTRARFNGYVYLERHGQVFLSRGFGMADAENKLPNTAQTTWPAFAATRFFVALAIMKLHDQGKLSVQDRICIYISDCPAAWRPITIRELLLNTSGIGSFDPFAPGVTLQGTMAACRAMPLVSPPGAISPWSDCNTLVLGVILEKVMGKTWEAAMHDLVYSPAGMTETGLMTNTRKPPRVGRFYRAGAPTPELNYDGYYLPYTTVEDLVRLNHALLAGKLVSHQSLGAMFAPVMRADPTDPTAPWLGYDVVINRGTATTYDAVCVVCVNGGGEDETGTHAGFFITDEVSPGARAMQIEINNDSAYFNPGDDDNAFRSFISKPLYGK